MLFAIIGGIVVGLVVVVSACASYGASLSVPPKDLARRWHAETRRRP
jgi:hypothetical protein